LHVLCTFVCVLCLVKERGTGSAIYLRLYILLELVYTTRSYAVVEFYMYVCKYQILKPFRINFYSKSVVLIKNTCGCNFSGDKSRKIRWAGHVTRVRVERNQYRVFVVKGPAADVRTHRSIEAYCATL
jgi:hypothetical protein